MYSLRRSLVLPRARQGALHAPRRDRTTAASAYPHSLSSSTILSRCQRGREEKGEEEVTRRGESVVCFAKKKKKKSKAEKRKESKFSSLTKQKAEAESKIVKHETTEVILDLLMLVENYSQKFNKPLMQGVEITSIAKEVWNAPFVLLFHKLREDGELPTFSYVNKAALKLFETTWDEFVGMESRNTAEAEDEVQSERDEYLAKALEEGCVDSLEVWRISQKGTRFLLKDVELWNIDSGEATIGQAAICREWQYEDETLGNVETLFAEEEEAEGEEGDEGEEGEEGAAAADVSVDNSDEGSAEENL